MGAFKRSEGTAGDGGLNRIAEINLSRLFPLLFSFRNSNIKALSILPPPPTPMCMIAVSGRATHSACREEARSGKGVGRRSRQHFSSFSLHACECASKCALQREGGRTRRTPVEGPKRRRGLTEQQVGGERERERRLHRASLSLLRPNLLSFPVGVGRRKRKR